MRSRRLLKTGLSVGLLLTAILPLVAQDVPTRKQELLAEVPKGLSGDVMAPVRSLGARMQMPGKEESDYVGEFILESGGRKNLRIVHQLSGTVHIETTDEKKDGKAPLKFDGTRSAGFVDRMDEALLETFVMDTVEGMIHAIRDGAPGRVLGRGFRPDPKIFRDYNGPRYDIYEVLVRVRSRSDQPQRVKRYYFDSATGLLNSTRYADPTVSPELKVETRFSDWRQVDGSAYPGRIERYENGSRVFTFNSSSITGRDKKSAAKSAK